MSQSDRPQLIHILRTLSGGGPPRLVFDLIRSRALTDYRHTVITLHGVRGDQGDMSAEYRDAGIRVLSCQPALVDYMPNKRLRRWLLKHTQGWLSGQFARLLKQAGTGLVHSQTDFALYLQTQAIVSGAHAPFVWTSQGFVSTRQDDELRAAMLLCQNGDTRVVAVSEAVKQDLVKRSSLTADQCKVIYNGFSPMRFNSSARRDEQWRAQQGIAPDALVFGAVGRLSWEKGYHLLLDALADLRRQGIAAHVMLVGEVPARDNLEEQIIRLGLQECAHLVGYQTNIAYYLRQMDVFVMPSFEEGLPIALIEALALGLPCIVTRVGGIPEILSDKDAIMVSPSAAELTQGMSVMLDTDTRQRYAQCGAAIAQKFTLDNCAQQYAELYTNLLTKYRDMKPH